MSDFIKRFVKAPVEQIDYDIDFTDFLEPRADTIATFEADCDTGVSILSATQISGVIRCLVGGGEDGNAYAVEAVITTSAGRVRRGKIQVRVKGTELIGIDLDGGSPTDETAGTEVDGGTP